MSNSNDGIVTDTTKYINAKTDRIELPDGSFVESLETDISDESGATIFSTVTKGFGDRKYTASYNVYHFAYPDTKLRLINRYKINSKGLTMTSTSTSETSSVFPTSVVVTSNKITDKYAEIGKIEFEIY
ncbi:putative RecB family nuclease [Gracilibacillus halotolerans]|uniref:Putative RecB family nuclease n=1 Tax=Gracilibacillus halotolerans TaxID=74386 RepID=A0A841RIW8_9BACI|nr:putative RecB family nuclease [Gracilibacillus halotolerans]